MYDITQALIVNASSAGFNHQLALLSIAFEPPAKHIELAGAVWKRVPWAQSLQILWEQVFRKDHQGQHQRGSPSIGETEAET